MARRGSMDLPAHLDRRSDVLSLVIGLRTVDNKPSPARTRSYIPDRRCGRHRTRLAHAVRMVQVRIRSGPGASHSETRYPGGPPADLPGSLAGSHRGDTPKQFADSLRHTSDTSS